MTEVQCSSNYVEPLERRKRGSIEECPISPKKTCFSFYVLESESSLATEDDTESVYSLQGKETDLAQDTPDTDTKSEYSSDDVRVEVEYELVSSSDDNSTNLFGEGSSGGSDNMYAVAGALAAGIAGIAGSSLEASDAEDSDNSSIYSEVSNITSFWKCIQCQDRNNNPDYRFCQKCFKDRKEYFPSRPKAFRRKRKSTKKGKEKLKGKKPALKVQLRDSGLGSQESSASSQEVFFVPQALGESSKEIIPRQTLRKKRSCSESEVDHSTSKRIRLQDGAHNEEKCTVTSSNGVANSEHSVKEMCILCYKNPKDSIFLHGTIAHMCCCYTCAKRTWNQTKRCPLCKTKVRNVVKVFTS